MTEKLATPEQYRTLADLVERRDRYGCLATYSGWLIWANPNYPLVRIFADGRFEEIKLTTVWPADLT